MLVLFWPLCVHTFNHCLQKVNTSPKNTQGPGQEAHTPHSETTRRPCAPPKTLRPEGVRTECTLCSYLEKAFHWLVIWIFPCKHDFWFHLWYFYFSFLPSHYFFFWLSIFRAPVAAQQFFLYLTSLRLLRPFSRWTRESWIKYYSPCAQASTFLFEYNLEMVLLSFHF